MKWQEDVENCTVRSSIICIFHQIVLGDRIKYEMGRVCSTWGEMRNAYRVLVRKPEGRSRFRRPGHKWKDNIKMDLRKLGLDCGLDSSGSGQGPVAGSCEHSNEPSGFVKGKEFLD
jgi:hypothetical protein